MRFLVTGAAGQLGTDVQRVLLGLGPSGPDADPEPLLASPPDITAIDLPDLDLTDRSAVLSFLQAWAAGSEEHSGGGFERLAVLNCAAYTAVDAAEEQEDLARRVNADAVGFLAEACALVDASLVHVSTDYVFDGARPPEGPPWEVSDAAEPRTAYGRTKLAGEQAATTASDDVRVLRTAWVYGAAGQNFVKTMARLEGERETLTVVADQVGAPTWSWHLARALVQAVDVPPGTYHVTGSGQTSWHGFAQAVFEELGADPERVTATTSENFPRPAPRPAYSVLSSRAWTEAGQQPLPEWREALAEAFRTVGPAFRE